jgi:flagellar protein FliO/FliZ
MAQQSEALVSGISPVSNSGVLELVAGLAFVILLIFVLAGLYKRFGNAGIGMGGLIKVTAAMSLGNRDRIALITVGPQQLLIGISPGRISTLHVFEDSIDLDMRASPKVADIKRTGSGSGVQHEFAQKLQSLISGTST